MSSARSLKLLGTGGCLWLLSVAVTVMTRDTILVPTVILLGTFLVPVTMVAWAWGRAGASALTAPRLASAFVSGGVLGILSAAMLEHLFLRAGSLMYVQVGLLEEAAKLGVLAAFARGLDHHRFRDGILLGAAIGFGYAAFESSGYALNAFSSGSSLSNLVRNELVRGATAPLGHGLWTAILGGVLFAALASPRRLRAALGLTGAYLLVATLHALWDSIDGIAAGTAARLLPGRGHGDQLMAGALNLGDSALVAAVGLLAIYLLWQRPAGRDRQGLFPRPSS